MNNGYFEKYIYEVTFFCLFIKTMYMCYNSFCRFVDERGNDWCEIFKVDSNITLVKKCL